MIDFATFLLSEPADGSSQPPAQSTGAIDWWLVATAGLIALIFVVAAVMTTGLILWLVGST